MNMAKNTHPVQALVLRPLKKLAAKTAPNAIVYDKTSMSVSIPAWNAGHTVENSYNETDRPSGREVVELYVYRIRK